MVCLWQSEDSFVGLVLSFLFRGCQGSNLGHQACEPSTLPLSHLPVLNYNFQWKETLILRGSTGGQGKKLKKNVLPEFLLHSAKHFYLIPIIQIIAPDSPSIISPSPPSTHTAKLLMKHWKPNCIPSSKEQATKHCLKEKRMGEKYNFFNWSIGKK